VFCKDVEGQETHECFDTDSLANTLDACDQGCVVEGCPCRVERRAVNVVHKEDNAIERRSCPAAESLKRSSDDGDGRMPLRLVSVREASLEALLHRNKEIVKDAVADPGGSVRKTDDMAEEKLPVQQEYCN